MKINRSMSYIFNKDAYLSLSWLLLMQVIVALSTFLIASSMKYIQVDTELAYVYLILFVVSLFIVYFPSAISSIYLEKWKVTSQQKFISGFTSLNFGKRFLDRQNSKDEHDGWVSTESMILYTEASDSIYEIVSTLLNTFLSIIIISFILDVEILLWYAVAICLVTVVKIYTKDRIETNAALVQERRNSVIAILSRMWVNTISGSPYNFKKWTEEYTKNSNFWKKTSASNELFLIGVSSFSAVLVLLIVCTGNILYLVNLNSIEATTVFIVTIPRQVQIMQNSFVFFNCYLKWKGVAKKINNLDSHLDLDYIETKNYIDLKLIRVNGNRFKNINDLKNYIYENQRGRFTITGKNGSGKSTLLRKIVKDTDYIFIPSAFRDLELESLRNNKASDGESVRKLFDSIYELKGINTFYLDEWDASLDSESKRKMNEEVNDLANTKLIIEVVHEEGYAL